MWESIFSYDQTLVSMFSSWALLLQVTVLPLHQFVWAELPCFVLNRAGVRATRDYLSEEQLERGSDFRRIHNRKGTLKMLQVWGFTGWVCHLKIRNEICWGPVWELRPLKQGRIGTREVTNFGITEKTQTIRTLKEERNQRKTGERSRRAMQNKEQSVHKMMKKKKRTANSI